ncbi:MAG: P1 family peptidase [Myxococcales bacterium]|nr:P1 family peptidase [Myxococcales bacterium]
MGAITDVAGVEVGQWSDREGRTGVTAVLFETGAVGAGLLLGASPTTRGFESLYPRALPKPCHGVCFAGGSTFGLGATDGVQRWLREKGRGLPIDHLVVPLVPSAIIFDLLVGRSGAYPDAEAGYRACEAASRRVEEGNVGAGTGALVGKLFRTAQAMAGGVGTASASVGGATVGVLAVVNAFGDVRDPRTGAILAGARRGPDSLELADSAAAIRAGAVRDPYRALTTQNTTLALVVTDAALEPARASIVAQMAAVGLARTISPVFTPYDGDLVVVLSTGQQPVDEIRIGVVAADLIAEAVVRGIGAAEGFDGIPCASDLAERTR